MHDYGQSKLLLLHLTHCNHVNRNFSQTMPVLWEGSENFQLVIVHNNFVQWELLSRDFLAL